MADITAILNAIKALSDKVDQMYGILEDGNAFSRGHVGLRDVATKIDALHKSIVEDE